MSIRVLKADGISHETVLEVCPWGFLLFFHGASIGPGHLNVTRWHKVTQRQGQKGHMNETINGCTEDKNEYKAAALATPSCESRNVSTQSAPYMF